MFMDMKYKTNESSTYMINYHIVFCSRRRRKIFDVDGVIGRFKVLVAKRCEELDIEVATIVCGSDYAYLILKCLPTHSPSDIMYHIKRYTSKTIRAEFEILSKSGSLWTLHYLVSTAETIDNETIYKYVESQPKRT